MFHRLGDLGLTTLLGAQIPLGTRSLRLGNNLITSLEHIPLSVTYLDLGCSAAPASSLSGAGDGRDDGLKH